MNRRIKSFIVFSFIWILVSVVQEGSIAADKSKPGSIVNFRNISGTCQGRPEKELWDKSLSWDRHDFLWHLYEPEQGKWNEQYMQDWCKNYLAYKARNVRIVPVLGYNAKWSWDRTERTYEHRNLRWHIKPRDGDKFEYHLYSLKNGKPVEYKGQFGENVYLPGLATGQNVVEGDIKWALGTEHIKDWEKFIRRAVSHLRQEPYSVEYFQIWNEAWPTSGFWFGGMNEFMERIYLPAAKVIRDLGGKVVYGGWPCAGMLGEYMQLMDRHKAWELTDVLDIHYFPLSAMELLRKEAEKRGYPDMPIWQTEIGFTDDPSFIPNIYPRFLDWGLKNKWDTPDKYKLFYFAYWSPNDPNAYGYRHSLYLGEELSPHGISLKILAELLNGDIKLYTEVESVPKLKAELDERLSSMEAFAVEHRIVVTVHLIPNNNAMLFTDWNDTGDSFHMSFDDPHLQLTLKQLELSDVTKVERVDPSGYRVDYTNDTKVMKDGKGVEIFIPIRHNPKSPVLKWKAEKSSARNFYVVFTLDDKAS